VRELFTNTNFLGFLVVVAGVALSFHNSTAGHDVIIGGIGLIGGSNLATHFSNLATHLKNDKEQQA
jgi:uncharacterized membrane protein